MSSLEDFMRKLERFALKRIPGAEELMDRFDKKSEDINLRRESATASMKLGLARKDEELTLKSKEEMISLYREQLDLTIEVQREFSVLHSKAETKTELNEKVH